jgi:hypothetical protein
MPPSGVFAICSSGRMYRTTALRLSPMARVRSNSPASRHRGPATLRSARGVQTARLAALCS